MPEKKLSYRIESEILLRSRSIFPAERFQIPSTKCLILMKHELVLESPILNLSCPNWSLQFILKGPREQWKATDWEARRKRTDLVRNHTHPIYNITNYANFLQVHISLQKNDVICKFFKCEDAISAWYRLKEDRVIF